MQPTNAMHKLVILFKYICKPDKQTIKRAVIHTSISIDWAKKMSHTDAKSLFRYLLLDWR